MELEKRGVPTVVVCTDPFINTAKAMAAVCGIPDYPFAVVRHPVGSNTAEELRTKAEGLLPDAVRILTRG